MGEAIFSLTGRGTKGRSPKGRELGGVLWQGGSEPPSHQLKVWGSAESSPSGIRAVRNLVQLETSKVTTEIPYNV